MPPSVTFFSDGANRRPAGLPSGVDLVRRVGDRPPALRLTAVVRFRLNLNLSRADDREVSL
jgi:hypothetical protein